MFVPVVDLEQNPLMPTSPARARRWVKSKKATPFWKRGIWCVRLNIEPSARNSQEVVVGVDPGSKREGFTVKSRLHTYLNVQAHAVTWVKQSMETRRNLRRTRRNRNTPCRKPRWANRGKKSLSPSTKARWQWKLRVLNWLALMFPIRSVVVEDVQARSKNGKRFWNASFSPLEVGKQWFYGEIKSRWDLFLYQGYQTKAIRDCLGLKKTKRKLDEVFSAHCVDSWAMANDAIGGHVSPDNVNLLVIKPLQFFRRRLHVQNPKQGGYRKPCGSTRSLGFKRGSIIRHPKWGECLMGGTSQGRLSLHCRRTGKRLCRNVKAEDVKFLSFNSFLVKGGNSYVAKA